MIEFTLILTALVIAALQQAKVKQPALQPIPIERRQEQ